MRKHCAAELLDLVAGQQSPSAPSPHSRHIPGLAVMACSVVPMGATMSRALCTLKRCCAVGISCGEEVCYGWMYFKTGRGRNQPISWK